MQIDRFSRLACVALVLSSVFVAGCSSPGKSTGPIELFNGRNLEGWTCCLAKPEVKMQDVWNVQDGVLICKGEPLGYLGTQKGFTDFRLVVEWRWAPGTKPGNSGVLMRINGPARALPRCLEAQLQNGNAGDLLGLHGMAITGDPARVSQIPKHELAGDITIVKKIEALEKAPGEWNRYEIDLRGGSLKAWINGTLANEATGCETGTGPIALQSEGGEIHFRKVQVTELGP